MLDEIPMETLNEYIARHEADNNYKKLEEVEESLTDVIEHTRESVVNFLFYKQAVANRLLVQLAITRILGKK